MIDHIRARELAGRAELLVECHEERKINVNLAVGRTVKRSNAGIGSTAASVCLTREKLHVRLFVLALSVLAELIFPDDLRIAKNNARKLLHPLFFRPGG